MINWIEQHLEKGLKQMDNAANRKQLLTYLRLLEKWNKAYNLTAIREPLEMVNKHILDSLAVLPFLQGSRHIDIGTGAGLPGIPLAIALPEQHFCLLDSNGKKTRFLQAVKRELGLENISIVHSRVEDYHPEQTFDTVMSRAFTDLTRMSSLSQHLLHAEGQWLALKGRSPQEELQKLSHDYQEHAYTVPFLDGERCVIIIHQHNAGN